MTIQAAPDNAPKSGRENLVLPFASSDIETAGIRVTRAEFSRMMECSKQAVTDWVKSGRIVVGADGRFDPSKAVRSLLATGDPEKIRARVLTPLTLEMSQLRGRIRDLEAETKRQRDRAQALEIARAKAAGTLQSFLAHLELEWFFLDGQPEALAVAAFASWIKAASSDSGFVGMIVDHLPDGFADEWKTPALPSSDDAR